MPYAQEHSCRLRDPGDFQPDSFRRYSRKSDGKTYDVIAGRLKGETSMTEQAYRYPIDDWSADEARSHCTDHDGIEFEPAKESDMIASGNRAPCGCPEREIRTAPMRELRVLDEPDTGPRIVGYAAVFDEWSEDLDGFRERIQPGAFSKTLSEADVRALWNHNADYVLGRMRSGTLHLVEDKRGLQFEIQPPATTWAQDLLATMRRGDVDQMSFGFTVIRDEWHMVDDVRERTLIEVRLWDVSPVTFPAYPQTTAEVRARALELAPPAPGQAAHPGDSEEGLLQARLDLMRRRLDLLEVEL